MSNGEDVLDNWEEIDEARLKNTLQKIEAARKTKEENTTTVTTAFQNGAGEHDNSLSLVAQSRNVEKQSMKLLQRTPNHTQVKGNENSEVDVLKSPLDDMAASFQPVMMVLHKSSDDYQSANYTQPINSQTVKILRRPTQSSEPRNNGVKPKQPIKTLQQREQEYAEARLRILGSAKNPEDDVTANSTASTPTTATISTTTTGNPINKVNSSSKPLGAATTAYNNHNNYHHHQQQQQQQSNFYYQQPLPIAPTYNNRTPLLTTMALHHQSQSHNMHHQSSPALLTGTPAMPLQQTWSPIVGGSVSSPILRQQQQQQQQQLAPLPHQQQENVLRLPRGPDGSTGFQIRR